MNAFTEPVLTPRHEGTTRTTKEWLDALAGGQCDQSAFLSGVSDLLHITPEDGWDLLALVDQYYRRGKISADTFGALKTHLHDLLLGKGAGNSRPIAQSAARVAPVATQSSHSQSITTAIVPPVRRPHLNAVRHSEPVRKPVNSATGADSATAGPAAMDVLRPIVVGTVLRDRYRIEGVLGRGGMGTVYAATDQYRLDQANGDQKVAIKVLHTEVLKRPRLFAELRREFQHLQSLSHPNIVRVHEFDRDGNLAFFTMEYLSGSTLDKVLAAPNARRLPRSYSRAIIRDVGAAVAHAHARGVVHGDLNPSNIFITEMGDIRVLDFGASHQLHRGPWISEFDLQQPFNVATPSYASCQVLEGEFAGPRDDIYALACIASLLLTGRHPFNNETALKARSMHMTPTRPADMRRSQWQALRDALDFDRARRPEKVESWLLRMNAGAAAAHLPDLHSLYAVRPQRSSGIHWSSVAAATTIAVCLGWVVGIKHATIERLLDGEDASEASPTVQEQSLPATAPAPSAERQSESVRRTTTTAESAAAGGFASSSPSKSSMTARNAAPPTAVTPAVAAPPVHPPSAAAAATHGAIAAGPTTAGAYPVRARIELAVDSVEVAPNEAMARIVVKRSISWREDVGFKWWTESGTAKPGRDFVSVKSQIEHIDRGKNTVSLIVPLVMDPARRESRSFYVVLDEPTDNAALGQRTLAQVSIPPVE